jgi:3,4-dihydroxy 2-butanone 4-phosphate synthase / GTP cyclohydrolase II
MSGGRMSGGASLERAVAALREGRPVLVLDDVDRENEGDVVLAAQTLTDAWMGWTVRHSSGFVCAPMPASWADRLQLPRMVPHNEDLLRTDYTVSVDAAVGLTTGIGAAERATTVRLLAAADTVAADLRRPGHVIPLRARPGGVLERRGHTEAAVDLALLAGLPPVAVTCEVLDDDGDAASGDVLLAFAERHRIAMVSIDQIAGHRGADSRAPATLLL